MKAELAADGVLNIRTETELEAYALKKWLDDIDPPLPQCIKFTLDLHGLSGDGQFNIDYGQAAEIRMRDHEQT